MKILIVYCHPSEDSFTREVKDSFIAGLESAGHDYILSDLYAMNFVTDMSEEEYNREAYYRVDLPVPIFHYSLKSLTHLWETVIRLEPLLSVPAPGEVGGTAVELTQNLTPFGTV